MSTLTFHSCLAAELQRFVDLRRGPVPIIRPKPDCCCTSIGSWRNGR